MRARAVSTEELRELNRGLKKRDILIQSRDGADQVIKIRRNKNSRKDDYIFQFFNGTQSSPMSVSQVREWFHCFINYQLL